MKAWNWMPGGFWVRELGKLRLVVRRPLDSQRWSWSIDTYNTGDRPADIASGSANGENEAKAQATLNVRHFLNSALKRLGHKRTKRR